MKILANDGISDAGKELLEQTPRTTTTVLNASGVSMKSIISLLQEIKLK